MSKTDIFGKKPYREIRLKLAKVDLTYRYVLAIRTDADILVFPKMIYNETNYLFYISPKESQEENKDKLSDFQLFIHNDTVLAYTVFYLRNTNFDLNKRILGYDDSALFQIKRPPQKQKNQTTLILEKKADFMDFTSEDCGDEVQNWYDFKADLAQKSVDVMGKIDYIFPIQIETYEMLKPLLQQFSKMQELNYMLLEPKQINDAQSFFMHVDLITERINPVRSNTRRL